MFLKICFLLDSLIVPSWQKEIINFIRSNASFSIQLIVLNDSRGSHSSGNLVYKIFRKADRALFPSKHDCFQRVNISELLKGIQVINITPVCSTFTDEIPERDLTIIRNIGPDLLIRFGFRILKGGILQAAPYGVWSLHHGDNAVNRGGPPAFWEVVNKDPVTGVTLQVLSDDLDGGTVIDKAFVKTDRTSFNRNQNALYWAGVELFCSTLNKLVKGGRFPASGGEWTGLPAEAFANVGLPTEAMAQDGVRSFYSKPLYRNPDNAKAFLIFMAFWIRRLSEAIRSIFKKQQWSLYYKIKRDYFETSLFRYNKLTPPAGTDWADPFVVSKDNGYHVFFEEFIHRKGKAHISYFEFDSTGKLKSKVPVTVLDGPGHLSYPFIFEHEGIYYMIPESTESKSVCLYKCEKFPKQWIKFKELLHDTVLYDPSLLFHDNTWYLLGTQKPFEGNSPDQYLYIYFSDDLFSGSWQNHPQNPVTRDVRGARPAGRIFEYQGKLIRPSQIGAPKYGYGVRFQEIIRITRYEFEQKPFDEILPNWKEGLLATHTFNFANGFTVVDGQDFGST